MILFPGLLRELGSIATLTGHSGRLNNTVAKLTSELNLQRDQFGCFWTWLNLQIRKLQTQCVNVCQQFQHVAPSRHQAMPKKNFPPKVGDGRFEVQDKLGEACSPSAFVVAYVEGWPADQKSVDGRLADFADSVALVARSCLINAWWIKVPMHFWQGLKLPLGVSRLDTNIAQMAQSYKNRMSWCAEECFDVAPSPESARAALVQSFLGRTRSQTLQWQWSSRCPATVGPRKVEKGRRGPRVECGVAVC